MLCARWGRSKWDGRSVGVVKFQSVIYVIVEWIHNGDWLFKAWDAPKLE